MKIVFMKERAIGIRVKRSEGGVDVVDVNERRHDVVREQFRVIIVVDFRLTPKNGSERRREVRPFAHRNLLLT